MLQVRITREESEKTTYTSLRMRQLDKASDRCGDKRKEKSENRAVCTVTTEVVP